LLLILSIGFPTTCRTKISHQPCAFFFIYLSLGVERQVLCMPQYLHRQMINAILSASAVALTAREIADRIVLQFGHPITARQVYDCIYHIPENICLIEAVGSSLKRYKLYDKY